MSELVEIILLCFMAGIAMPLGATIASVERIRPQWLETEVRHSVIAFGGGALLAAVALVLVPEGIENLSLLLIVVCFAAGGITFMVIDILLAKYNTPFNQLIAMLSDFIPEAMALGATFTVSSDAGFLLAGIIALQNLPEGFNAFREVRSSTEYRSLRIVLIFTGLALLGPAAGAIGHIFLAEYTVVISCIMLFAAGGILYIVFQDIAPQAQLKRHWAPPLGAVAGFMLGLLGHVAVVS
nr:divalent cation transporter [Pseudohongiella sp. O18]